MESPEKKRRIHFLLPSDHGPMGLWMTQEEVAIVNKMAERYPGKYQGFEGTVQALIDYREKEQD